MKQLLLSFIIPILSYYPVHADKLSYVESKYILLNWEVLGQTLDKPDGAWRLYLRYINPSGVGNLYSCRLTIDTRYDDSELVGQQLKHHISFHDLKGWISN